MNTYFYGKFHTFVIIFIFPYDVSLTADCDSHWWDVSKMSYWQFLLKLVDESQVVKYDQKNYIYIYLSTYFISHCPKNKHTTYI